MGTKTVIFSVLLLNIVFCHCSAIEQDLEARGKKKKIALFVYFADLLVKKLFILKLVYAFVLWCVIHKAGYFLAWFVSYLKDKHRDIPDHHHVHHEEYYDHQPYGGYGPGPYKRS